MTYSTHCSLQEFDTQGLNIEPLLETIVEEMGQRFDTLLKIDGYLQQKSPEMARMFARIIKHELELESKRTAIEKEVMVQIRSQKLTKRAKKALTQFSFSMIEKLAPGLNPPLQRHYINLAKLYELFFESVGRPDYLVKVRSLKNTNLIFKVELYVSLLELMLEYVNSTFKNRIQSTLQTLSLQKNRHMGDALLKNYAVKQKDREFKGFKDLKSLQLKYKIRLPSLKCGFLGERFKDQSISLSKKLNHSLIEVLGHKPFNQPSASVQPITLKELAHDIKEHKYRIETETSLPKPLVSHKNRSLFVDKSEYNKKTQLSHQSAKAKPTRLLAKILNPSVRTLHTKQDFLDQFSSNIDSIVKNAGLGQSLEWVKHDKRKPRREETAVTNEAKMLDTMVQRNTGIIKEITVYASRYNRLVQ